MSNRAIGRTSTNRPFASTRATVVCQLHSGETVVLRTKTYRRSPAHRAKHLIEKAGYILGEIQVIISGWSEFHYLSCEESSKYAWAPAVHIPDDDERRKK